MNQFLRQHIDLSKLPHQVLEKWPSSMLGEGFVPFPKKLLRCLHCVFPDAQSIQELAVLLAIADYKRPNLSRLPSSAYLAFLAGLEQTKFDQALQSLQQKGLIQVEGDSDGLSVSLTGLQNE